MMEKVSTGVNIILMMVVMVVMMTVTVTINPGDSGEGLFWSQNPLSEHQMRSYDLSAIQLGESDNQDLMRCDQNGG